MKEPEQGDPACPRCGTPGEPVAPKTLEAQLQTVDRAQLAGTVFYCGNPACATAYFNAWGAAVAVDRLASRAAPKSPEAPICPCFGLKEEDVTADARDGRKDRVRDLVERAKGPEARCAELCPDGQPCLTRVLRLFRETMGKM